MQLRQIKEFLTLAELENMSRAAEYLSISQPALSKSIAKLENELGVSLFDRNGRSISLNEAGTMFLESCERILNEWNECSTQLSLLARDSASLIRIGTFGVCDPLTDRMVRFRKEHGADVEFIVSTEIENEAQIDIKKYDVLVYPAGPKYEFFHGHRFYREEYFLAVPAGAGFPEEPVTTARMLQGLPMIWCQEKAGASEFPRRVTDALLIPTETAAIVDSRELQRDLVAAGAGCALVPSGSLRFFSSAGGILLSPIPDQRFSRQIMICFRREKHLSETAKKFRDSLLRSLSPEGSPGGTV